MKISNALPFAFCLLLGAIPPLHAQVEISSIPYQGRIEADGQPFTGNGEFRFMLLLKNQNPLSAAPFPAFAVVTGISGGSVTNITVAVPGAGYDTAPTVTITGNGTGATAIAAISPQGEVTGISVTNGGQDYTGPVTVTVADPPPAEIAVWTNESGSPTGMTQPSASVTLPVTDGIFHTNLGDASVMSPISISQLNQDNTFLRVWFDDGVNGAQQLSPDTPLNATPYSFIASSVVGPSSGTIGTNANTLGFGNIASGQNSLAVGAGNTASGFSSVALGFQSIASNSHSIAIGDQNQVSGFHSFAFGDENIVSERDSAAIGVENTTTGIQSYALGVINEATGSTSFAFGFGTTSSGTVSTSMGNETIASGTASFAAGNFGQASGRYSVAMGNNTRGLSFAEMAVGTYNTTYTPDDTFDFDTDDRLFVIGNGTANNSRSDALIVYKNGRSVFKATPPGNNGNLIANYASVMENTDSSGGDVLALKAGSATPGASTNFMAFFDSADALLGEVDGNGTGGVQYKSTGADYAEYLLPRDLTESFSPGDVVAVRDGRITKNTRLADQMMVISTNPIMVGNMPKEEDTFHQKVAFIGQASVKVIGPVRSGDYLVASGRHDGTAIAKDGSELRLQDRNAIIGRAWESDDREEVKSVNTAVGLDLGPALAAEVQDLRQRVSDLESLEARLSHLEARMNVSTPEDSLSSLNPSHETGL